MKIRHLALVIAVISTAAPALAGNLRYTPTNPAFGGNPNINGFLVGTAQIQNQFTGSDGGGGGGGGGGVPSIDFPPIVIDLGGLGGAATPPPADPAPTPAPTMP